MATTLGNRGPLSTAARFQGTVPVEADGSVYFRAPARKPLYFQAVDAEGRAVQGMRSVTYLQPGERRGCVGCHEGNEPAAPRTLEDGLTFYELPKGGSALGLAIPILNTPECSNAACQPMGPHWWQTTTIA